MHGLALKSTDRTQNMQELYTELHGSGKNDPRALTYQKAVTLMHSNTISSCEEAQQLFG